MDSINFRIKFLIDSLYNGNISLFCRSVGIKQPTLNTIVGERQSKPSFDILYAIASNVASLNVDWLITGEGEAFSDKKGDNLQKDEKEFSIIESQQRTIENLSETIKLLSNK